MMSKLNLIDKGIFTIPIAAELVGAPINLVRIWVDGHKGKQSPIIDNELGRVDGKLAISFTNLMELQFVAFFSKAGVQLRNIRAIMHDVRRILVHPHPFATHTVFQTDGRKIVARIAKENGVESIYDLKTKNYEMKEIVLKSLMCDVVYDPAGNASIWYPRRDVAPNVIINPKRSFGRPILRDSEIPTSTIAKAFAAEKNAKMVSALFEIPERRVREAVKFETALRAAA
jgi:uncharacterized protein (DUF433 family)